MDNVIELKDLHMSYHVGGVRVRAIQNVSLSLPRGSSIGIVGESGCGKSSVALAILRLLPQNAAITGGEILFDGMNLANASEREMQHVRWNRIAMVFQGAMNALNPVITIGTQLVEPVMKHANGPDCADAARMRALELIEAVNLTPDVLTRYPHELSGGMKQRVIVAMSLMCSPELVIADEPTTALDVIAQDNVLALIEELQRKLKLSLILISHDISVVAETCERIAVMYAGGIVETGMMQEVFSTPAHPYTRALLSSIPSLRGPKTELVGIPGEPPDLSAEVRECRFVQRCQCADEICRVAIPRSVSLSPTHRVECHRAMTTIAGRASEFCPGSGPDR
jgi:oligopeptide/dipeptide ABC transporter ATP-binding protein